MDKHQPLRDALLAGPTEGPFNVVKEEGSAYSYDIKTADGYIVATTHGFVRDEGDSLPLANFYAAANPAAISALLADLDAAVTFIDDLRQDLHSRRVADWYPEGAHNAAEAMSEDMRLLGNRCADFEVTGNPFPRLPQP